MSSIGSLRVDIPACADSGADPRRRPLAKWFAICRRDRGTTEANDGAAEEKTMRKFYGRRQLLALGLLASLSGAAAAQQTTPASAPPVFSPNANTGWVGIGIGAFIPIPGSPQPIGQDPAHRYISNDEAGVTGEQPSQRVSDIGNPNLKPWAKEVMKKEN